MKNTPYVIAKCAMSLDGYIDDSTSERLILSDEADFDRVDEERAKCDAILVGAETIRKDNPKLRIRSESRRKNRLLKGLAESLIKVTMTSRGDLCEELNFFKYDNSPKIVYCSKQSYQQLNHKVGKFADVVPVEDDTISPQFILEDLHKRGVNRLMIEGGSKVLTMFLAEGCVDELQVSIAPFFVGQEDASKFVNSANFPHNKNNRMKLERVEMIGDMAMLTYKL